jgi:hypothetical protein
MKKAKYYTGRGIIIITLRTPLTTPLSDGPRGRIRPLIILILDTHIRHPHDFIRLRLRAFDVAHLEPVRRHIIRVFPSATM